MRNYYRKGELRSIKLLANVYLDFYKNEQKNRNIGWKKNFIKRNITILKSIIQKVNKAENPDKLIQYNKIYAWGNDRKPSEHESLKEHFRLFSEILGQGTSQSLFFQTIRCSPITSYYNDFGWFPHGSVDEHIKFALGEVDESIFDKYLPVQVKQISYLQETFFKRDDYVENREVLMSILHLIKRKELVSANILIITLIEGIVRKFCLQIYKKQNPNKSASEIERFIYHSNPSLEFLILNKEWKPDIPVRFTEIMTAYSHSEHEIIYEVEEKYKNHLKAQDSIIKRSNDLAEILSDKVNSYGGMSDNEFKKHILEEINHLKLLCDELMKDEDEIVMIPICVYLDFLIKKIKDDRNKIIHGQFLLFKQKWTTLIYLSALELLIKKIEFYINLDEV